MAYVWTALNGKGAGMAWGPLGPTVHSVARMVRLPTGVDSPLGCTMLHVVPAGTSTTDFLVPLSSVTGVASCTCMPAVPLKSMLVDSGSLGVITTSGSHE